MISISVIIPNYNHAAFLKERIESVLFQTYADFEVIILDDCSTDNSKEVIENYRPNPKITNIVYAAQNSGSPFRQWQKGIELAKGDWIWIAESDDVALPGFLETAAEKIMANEKAGLYYCNSKIEIPGQADTTTAAICNERFQSSSWEKSYTINGTDEINRALKFRSCILNASAVVFSKHLFKNQQVALEKFRYYGDWYAYLNILPGCSVIYNQEIHNLYRRTESSHSQLMDVQSKAQVKEECFRILLLLQRSPVVKDKKEVLNWFVRKYVGFGMRSDGMRAITKLAVKYYSINFRLATIVLAKTFLLKLSPRDKK